MYRPNLALPTPIPKNYLPCFKQGSLSVAEKFLYRPNLALPTPPPPKKKLFALIISGGKILVLVDQILHSPPPPPQKTICLDYQWGENSCTDQILHSPPPSPKTICLVLNKAVYQWWKNSCTGQIFGYARLVVFSNSIQFNSIQFFICTIHFTEKIEKIT